MQDLFQVSRSESTVDKQEGSNFTFKGYSNISLFYLPKGVNRKEDKIDRKNNYRITIERFKGGLCLIVEGIIGVAI